MPQEYDVAVIGAGMAGLAAAHLLSTRGLSVIVLDKSDRPGGRARTIKIDEKYVETGAAFISAFYTETLRLIDETGLRESLYQRSQNAYVARDRVVEPLWPIGQLVRGGALSRFAQYRLLALALPMAVHWRRLDITRLAECIPIDKRSAGDFGRRWLGAEATDYFFNPLLRGLMYWDADTTSAAVVYCILKSFGRSKGTYRLAQGMLQLATALCARSEVRLNCQVTTISPSVEGTTTVAYVRDATDEQVAAKTVICATTAPEARVLTPWLPASMAAFLADVTYSRTTMLTFSVPAQAEGYPQGAVLFPSSTVRELSSLNPLYQYIDGGPGDARPDRLVNVYLSNAGALATDGLSDKQLADRVIDQMNQLLDSPAWTASSTLRNVQRWQYAIPRFDVGYIAKMTKFTEEAKNLDGFAFAGDYLGAPYIDAAISSGLRAAEHVFRHLAVQEPADRSDALTAQRTDPPQAD
jgi:protoporphyrinogen/coproporphyrinogen III oxidase